MHSHLLNNSLPTLRKMQYISFYVHLCKSKTIMKIYANYTLKYLIKKTAI